MTHPAAELTAYLDGALSPAEREQVAAHLSACAACRAEHDRLAAGLAILARLPPAAPPSAAFERRFYARLAAQKRSQLTVADRLLPRWRGAWRWLAPAMASAAAAAAVMLYTGARHRGDEAFIAEHLDLF